jgi:very-short-patch-repair endonuclease
MTITGGHELLSTRLAAPGRVIHSSASAAKTAIHSGEAGPVLITFPRDCSALVTGQCGVITRRQAIGLGIDGAVIDNQLRLARWQRLYRGVYATFTGPPPREAWLTAALLRAGPGATLSYQTAAELCRLSDEPSAHIHITVPVESHPRAMPGVVIHRSRRVAAARHPALIPARTRVEETTLDLIEVAAGFNEAYGWLCLATGRRLTTASRLRSSVTLRNRMRWRGEILGALTEIADGVHSNLQRRYVHDVERAHRLPTARRQARIPRGARSQYLDNLYDAFDVAVELDGRAAHPLERRWADIHRDNFCARSGIVTLRYNWADITSRACWVAAELSAVLRKRGWLDAPRRCSPSCALSPQLISPRDRSRP